MVVRKRISRRDDPSIPTWPSKRFVSYSAPQAPPPASKPRYTPPGSAPATAPHYTPPENLQTPVPQYGFSNPQVANIVEDTIMNSDRTSDDGIGGESMDEDTEVPQIPAPQYGFTNAPQYIPPQTLQTPVTQRPLVANFVANLVKTNHNEIGGEPMDEDTTEVPQILATQNAPPQNSQTPALQHGFTNALVANSTAQLNGTHDDEMGGQPMDEDTPEISQIPAPHFGFSSALLTEFEQLDESQNFVSSEAAPTFENAPVPDLQYGFSDELIDEVEYLDRSLYPTESAPISPPAYGFSKNLTTDLEYLDEKADFVYHFGKMMDVRSQEHDCWWIWNWEVTNLNVDKHLQNKRADWR